MAISPLELGGTLQRVQDIALIKQNQDNKAAINQTNIQSAFYEEVDEAFTRVRNTEETHDPDKKMDARDQGKNQYHGDGGKKRKKQDPIVKDRVIVKGKNNHFDIKI